MNTKRRLYIVILISAMMIAAAPILVTMCSRRVASQQNTVEIVHARGYSTGKECYYGRACGVFPTFMDCLECCLGCPQSLQDECIDLCLDHHGGKMEAALEAALTVRDGTDSEKIAAAVTFLQSAESSTDERFRRVAARLREEMPNGLFHR